MSKKFWRDQQAAAFVALAGGLLFWYGYGLLKGVIFAIALMLILQPSIFFSYWKSRK